MQKFRLLLPQSHNVPFVSRSQQRKSAVNRLQSDPVNPVAQKQRQRTDQFGNIPLAIVATGCLPTLDPRRHKAPPGHPDAHSAYPLCRICVTRKRRHCSMLLGVLRGLDDHG
jgi:hypothetical protein